MDKSCWSEARRRWRVLAVLALMALLWAPLGAEAEEEAPADAVAEAAAHHERGIELYQAGDVAAAAREFEAAQALAPAPSNLFNLARCYERLGQLDRAIAALEQYLASDLSADRRARGRAELERLRAEAASAAAPPAPDPGEGAADEDTTTGDGTADDGRGGDSSQEEPARRWRLTAALQVDLGVAFGLAADFVGVAPLVGGAVTGGINLGTVQPDQGRWGEIWPFRVDLYAAADAQPFVGGYLLEVIGGGRLSIALGHLPLRVEGELGLALVLARHDPPGGSGELQMSFGLVPGLSMAWQARRWLEVVLRPVRLEILGLAGEVPGSTGVFVRWGLDVQVRFRL